MNKSKEPLYFTNVFNSSFEALDKRLVSLFSSEIGRNDLGFDIDVLFPKLNAFTSKSDFINSYNSIYFHSDPSVELSNTFFTESNFALHIDPTPKFIDPTPRFIDSTHHAIYIGENFVIENHYLPFEEKTAEEKLQSFLDETYNEIYEYVFPWVETQPSGYQQIEEYLCSKFEMLLKDEEVYKLIVKKLKKRYRALREFIINKFNGSSILRTHRTDIQFRFEYIDLITNDEKVENLSVLTSIKFSNKAKKLYSLKKFLSNGKRTYRFSRAA